MYPADAGDETELIRKAEQALFLAKHSGKNKVCQYFTGAPETKESQAH